MRTISPWGLVTPVGQVVPQIVPEQVEVLPYVGISAVAPILYICIQEVSAMDPRDPYEAIQKDHRDNEVVSREGYHGVVVLAALI